MVDYVVTELETVGIGEGSPIEGMDQMSPFVWPHGDEYRIMMRAVPNPLTPDKPTGVIAWGTSRDGLTFDIDPKMSITPGTDAGDPDAGGCEDPTVQVCDNGKMLVWYTGVDAAHRQGCLMLASGPGPHDLTKRKVAIKASPDEGNIKEATLAQTSAGDWRLFYEYAVEDASRIGIARSDSPEGPWEELEAPFTIREESWDSWHLSTGPIYIPDDGGDPVMFYNGATHDARWRIGWISFDRDFTRVTGRGIEPLLVPPPPEDRDATDIAFAASCVDLGDRIALYYSLEDKILRRCQIRRYG